MKYIPLFTVMTAVICLVGCTKEVGGIAPEKFTDSLFAVLSADRENYTKLIIKRLGPNEGDHINPTEHWDEVSNGAPLPAQMFRLGSELVASKTDSFSYSLLSQWPINSQNNARTDVEKKGLVAIAENPSENFYGEETLGGTQYFTAIYPDIAVSKACVSCHNEHKDSPKTDFKLGQVMGGVVIRVPL